MTEWQFILFVVVSISLYYLWKENPNNFDFLTNIFNKKMNNENKSIMTDNIHHYQRNEVNDTNTNRKSSDSDDISSHISKSSNLEFFDNNNQIIIPNSHKDRASLLGLVKYSNKQYIDLNTDYLTSKLPSKYLILQKNNDKIIPFCMSGYSLLLCMLLCYSGSNDYANFELRKIYNNHNPKKSLNYLRYTYGFFKDYNLTINTYMLINKAHIELSEESLNIAKYLSTTLSILQSDFKENNAEDKATELVKLETNNNIKKIKIHSKSKVILLNFISFNINWKYSFDSSLTKKGKFYSSNNEYVFDVKYMNLPNKKHLYYENGKIQLLCLDFSYNNPFMLLTILRKSHHPKFIHPNKLKYFYSKCESILVDVTYPKFTMNTVINMQQLLKKMGYQYIFDEYYSMIHENFKLGDFHQICQLKICEESHNIIDDKNVIINDNNYTNTDYSNKRFFNANHPFNFYIVYKPDFNIIINGQY